MKLEKTLTFSDGQYRSAETLIPRQATLDDLELVVGLTRDFHRDSLWQNIPFDADHVRLVAELAIKGGGVFLVEGGFIAALIQPALFAPAHLMVTELCWYAPNGGGQALRETLETWARECEATVVQLTHPVNDKIEVATARLVERGYAPFEISYVKVL